MAQAELRTADEALAIALANSAAMAPARDGQSAMRLAATQMTPDQATPAFYVFQRGTDGGFVLVSAETETQPIIGYADEGTFLPDALPANAAYWLQRYAEQIQYMQSHPVRQRLASAATYPSVANLIGTNWNQEAPYNMLCPTIGGTAAPTGCVATAMAQIMYKHRYPTTGTGSHSYRWRLQTLSANFGTTNYDWANMTPKYNSLSSTAAKQAVATLMYHLGVAVEMDYGADGSSASAVDAMQGIINYFGYDAAIRPYMLDYHGEETTMQAIASELSLGRPVFFSAFTKDGGGHAFVGEGMRNDGFIYINWGWGGVANGYYALTLLDPLNQGVGGSASDEAYTESVVIYGGIQPNAGGESKPLITTAKAAIATDLRISKNTTTGISLTRLSNSGIDTWSGNICLVIYNADGSIYGGLDAYTDESLDPQYYFSSVIDVAGNLSSLAPGNYTMGACVTKTGENIVYPIYARGMGRAEFGFTVTADSIIFDAANDDPQQETRFTHTQLINTRGSNSWALDMHSPLFWESSSAGDDMLLRCVLHSGSATSVIGSYLLDGSNTGAASTIAPTNPIFAVGKSTACYTYTPSDIQLTFTHLANRGLGVDYHIVANGETLTGFDSIPEAEQDWWLAVGTSNYDNADNIVFDPVSALSVSTAKTLRSSLSADSSAIPYLIRGVVSKAGAATQAGTCTFTIADPEATQQTLRCTDMRGLDNAAFTADTTPRIGDTVVVYAHLSSNILVGCKGRLYKHSAATLPSALTDASAASGVSKFFREGRFFIRKDGQDYDLLGRNLSRP